MVNRKVVLKMVLSFDGFATSLDGTHDWMFEFFCDDSGWNQRALDQAGTHAMGRPRPLPLADHGRHPRRTRHRPDHHHLSLIHISEPTRRTPISYAVFCLKKQNKQN